MQLIRGQLRLTRRLLRSVVTMGNFDGLHRGHQQLLNTLRQQAQRQQAPMVVITFEPQPQEFLHPARSFPRLMRFHEKWRCLAAQNVDYCVCLRFNAQLAQYSAAEFVRYILVEQLGMQAIVVGDDFRFGANRAGDATLLRQLGQQYHFDTLEVLPLLIAGERVSSTRIRQNLQAGRFEVVEHLSGRRYFLCGKVIHGDARGRQWGFPTANIRLTGKPVAVAGIYAVLVYGLGERPLPAVASVGKRPMFMAQQDLLEVHLLDFNRDIYGRQLTVEFLHKLRDEQIFSTTAALIEQIHQDVQETRRYFTILEKTNDIKKAP